MNAVLPAGTNRTRLWGLTPRERLARIAGAQDIEFASGAGGGPLVSNLDFVWDPAWLRWIAERPDHVLTHGGVPVLAHVVDLDTRLAVTHAMAQSETPPPGPLTIVAYEDLGSLGNEALRKREKPFLGRLTPETVPALERASYFGAYKGVTDLLTKYLWPEWALVLTRWAARFGITPNQVTAVGALMCVAATFLFYEGWYWTGLVVGLGFMVLDTVDGKLARCTITSSWLGNIFDHGIDLVHPPFWWWAWGVGLHAYGRPLSEQTFAQLLIVIVGGYVVQRVIEGFFMRRYKMHIHVWRRFDSQFRLITARRNPNMVILLAFLAVGRPDWGLIAVAAWTLISLVVHAGQLVQALAASARGRPVTSWLA
ncbi:CDP-alcohol phosphatidyltransferase family protein [Allosphingosinicella deserti]|uniref:Phosphatidylglycerophosphate synthase n=1 Tax=Allosphingosinicella deserti TaxID=2116704 RepID=A0A2P7QGD7_9SPHN|nr:CDP-alcohol phosphatidyltransferase family protein [Sphingomonas deserti]PSJ37000.1 phosphatidylglycerophosphate synthase [Sphingomonas deserti]